MSQEKTNEIQMAGQALRAGHLVVFPTETVYGLGADARNDRAVAQIFAAKNRPEFNPLIVHIADAAGLDQVVNHVPALARKLMDAFWPGPLTLVLPKHPDISDLVTAGLPTVGVRVPAHPVALALLHAANIPVAAPSANLSCEISPTALEHVPVRLLEKAKAALDGGAAPVGLESTIVGFIDDKPRLLRLGGLSVESIESVVGPVERSSATSQILSPGQMKRHYSPRTPSRFFDALPTSYPRDRRIGILSLTSPPLMDRLHTAVELSAQADLEEAARNLFRKMRELDERSFDEIWLLKVPDVGLGRAINDRMRRAAS